MQKALTKVTVGSLWDEDRIPLIACVCVALSLCRLLLGQSCESVTDENKNGHLAHANKTISVPSIKLAQRPLSAAPLSAKEEQVRGHRAELSIYLKNLTCRNFCSKHSLGYYCLS